MSNGNGSTPAAFYNELVNSSAVQRAFDKHGLNGEAPRGWVKAAEAARAAQWKVRASFPEGFAETLAQSRDRCADDLANAQWRLAQASAPRIKAELECFVANCSSLLAAAQSLVDACPQEAERVAAQREREQR